MKNDNEYHERRAKSLVGLAQLYAGRILSNNDIINENMANMGGAFSEVGARESAEVLAMIVTIGECLLEEGARIIMKNGGITERRK